MKYFNLNYLGVKRCHFITSSTSNLESLWDLTWLLQVLCSLYTELFNHVHQHSFEKPAILTLPDSASNLLLSCSTFPRQYFINISTTIFSSSSLHTLSCLCFLSRSQNSYKIIYPMAKNKKNLLHVLEN